MTFERRSRTVDLMDGWNPKSVMMGTHLTRLMDPWMTILRQPKYIAPNPYQLQPKIGAMKKNKISPIF